MPDFVNLAIGTTTNDAKIFKLLIDKFIDKQLFFENEAISFQGFHEVQWVNGAK